MIVVWHCAAVAELKTVPDADAWIVRSAAAGRLNSAVLRMAAAGMVAAGSLVLLAAISSRPTISVRWVLVVAVPVMVVGQLWMIAWGRARLDVPCRLGSPFVRGPLLPPRPSSARYPGGSRDHSWA